MSWMTQTEAAAALGCSIRTVRRRVRAGSLTARREGRRLLIEVDTDKALSTVTQVGRHLAEVGASAAIQRREDADSLTTIHETFKDILSSLASCQDRAERDIGTYRRSARRGWAMASFLGIGLASAAWFIHTERVAHSDGLHVLENEVQAIESAAETAMVTSEVRHAGEMTTVAAQRKAEVTALHDALNHERANAASLEDRLGAAARALAGKSTDLRLVADERDRLAHETRLTAQRLQYTLLTSKLAGSVRSLWSSLQATADRSAGLD
ncbi:MAG: helix-turn-helix domain-containing protein, partial [Planctomycetes bacterium]|nr:helix-turn-helix domain-containing protein [Planctomycetota bacterium]